MSAEKGKKGWTLLDYWFHAGVAINLAVVALILWYAMT